MCFFISIGVSVAQTTFTTGVVVDENGDPVIGASVMAKDTSTGTVTDIDGKFSLNIPSNTKTLVISYLGMIPKEVAAGANLRIVLNPDTKTLQEVVVTALGISKEQKSLGYAVQSVKADELTQAANSSLAGALQGKTSGLDIKPSSGMPGASSQIVIRGARSFSGDNTPLYIIDGMPVNSTSDAEAGATGGLGAGDGVTGTDYSNRAVDIDPNDIETINILKGQAASALYGIRASNGVIVITTKSGKGLAKGKPQVTFSSNVTFDKIGRYPELQTTYAQGSKGAYLPTSSGSWGPKISELPNDPTYGGNVPNSFNNNNPTAATQGKYYQPQRANAGMDPWTTPAVYNNIKEFFNVGHTWNNSLNVAQAWDKSSYSLSLGSSNQEGIIPTTGMDRYNAKLTAEARLHDNWKSGFAANYINTSISKMPTANDGIVATIYPAPANYDLAGIPAHYKNDPYTQNNYRAGSFPAAYWSIDNNEFTESTNRFFGNAFAEYATKLHTENHKLAVKYLIGTDSYTTNYQDLWGYGNKGSGGSNAGQVENYSWTKVTFNSLLTANYDWKINEEWDFNALLGNEIIQNNRKYLYEYGANFQFPGWNHIDNTTSKNNSEQYWTDRTVGFFGSASATYKNMLYLTVTGRNDYVSTMPRDNRSFFYPSASVGFVLSELEAFKNDVVNYAKLRASYAQVGQAGNYLKNYYYIPTYGSGFYTFTPLLYPITNKDGSKVNGYVPYFVIFDSDLKPQNTKSYEFGFDANFFNNLLTLNYTFSRQNVNDQIFEVPLAGSTGAQSMLTNGGDIHTNSHEITLSVNPIRTKDVDWNFAFNWTKVDNYVDALAPGVESIFLGGFVTPQVRANVGDKFPVIYGTQYLRDDQGRLIVDVDGMPQAGEPGVIGKVSPDFILGFNTSLRVRNFTLAAVLDWKSGGQMYSGTNGLLDFYGVSKKSGDREGTLVVDGVKDIGTKDNPEYVKNDIPISGPNGWQDYYSAINGIDESSIYDNSFVKLREIVLGCRVLKKQNLELNVSAFARNILVWSEYPNFDPESSQGNNNMAGAFERFSLPQTSSYGFGFNVKF